MRARTDTAEEWVFGIGCPAADHDSVNAKRRDSEHEKNSYVYIRNHHRNTEKCAAEGNDRDCDDGRHHGEARCEPVIKSVHVGGREIFFQQQFEHVRNGLE